MANQLARRSSAADLEIRGDGRTVVGIAVPFGQPARIGGPNGYAETFTHGSFTRTLTERGPERIKLLALHDDAALPLGRLSVAREDRSGLYIEGRVSQTQAGDEVLELVRDGALDAFSIGFVPVRDQWTQDRSAVTRQEVALREISIVAFPAFEGALISAVRNNPTPQPIPAHLDPNVWAMRFRR
jgi:uncharacterized protein